MNIDEKIKELEEKQAEILKEIEELKKEKENTFKRWRAEKNREKYFLMDINKAGRIDSYIDEYSIYEDFFYSIGNYFKTQEEAKRYKQNRLTYQQLKDIALRLNKGQEIDWKNVEQGKYYIFYDSVVKKFESGICGTYRNLTEIYCVDKSFLDMALEEIGEEKLKQLLEWGI